MLKSRFLQFFVLGIALAATFSQSAYAAITTSWWRFELDEDPSATGLSIANEIESEPPLVSSNARLGSMVPDLFDTFLPGTDISNSGSALAVNTGGANAGIFGTAAYSPTLDLGSFTVEFWVRTTESTAGFVARTSIFENAAESATLVDGFSIVDPNNVQVSFYTSAPDGTDAMRTTLASNTSINDGNWHYIAFRYDANLRSADLIVDSKTVGALVSGAGERPLWWGGTGSTPSVIIGYQMDGNEDNNTGTFDELRFTNQALEDDDLLVIPEPGKVALIAAIGILILTGTFRRRQSTGR